MSPSFDDIPRPSLWKRFLLGAFLIIFAAGAATSIAAFREVDKVVNALKESESILGVDKVTADVDPGEPQTIMLLGSDRRPNNATDGGAGMGARSDTIILARLDGDKPTALMSLPRDLKVDIPGHGVDKINAAYELGGPKLTVETVKQLTGLSINHVVNVDFQGFRNAIDAIGCIYMDVDRRYYNDSADYAYINLYPGYQKLCGEKALEFARFRHLDSDLFRGVRQQNVLREVKQQVGVGNLIEDRDKLIKIFGKHTTSDARLKNRGEILSLFKLAIGAADETVREVQFEGEITAGDEATGTPSYVVASGATVKRLAREFLGDGPAKPAARRPDRPRRKRRPRGDGGLFKEPAAGKEQAVAAIQQGAGGRLPVYYPTVFLKGSSFVDAPRSYRLKGGGERHRGYRMVLFTGTTGEYYGVQGTTWKEPPILDSPSDEREVGGRTYELHYDGDRVRLVAWRTDRATYWVSNTLVNSLDARQMLTIARSARLP